MQQLAWFLILIGLIIALMGFVLLLIPSVPWLGRLPGDIRIEGEHVQIYIPLATSLLISVVLTLVLWTIGWFACGR
ncbi:MAG: DUF2905 domain-containing protein [Planctomycetota bacterium]|nr:MAG: DUF2905 domain-containing protein [Planctomycetota bacterium]